MAYLLALASAALYGAADFLGGLASRRESTTAVVVLAQSAGLLALLLVIPFLPESSPSIQDLVWGTVAGVAGGAGVGLLYRALAVGRMAVVAPTTAVCAVVIPATAGLLAGDRLATHTAIGMVLALTAIVLVSREASGSDASEARQGLFPRGTFIALAAGVAIGLFFLALARAQPAAGMWPLVCARLGSVVLFGVLAIGTGQSLRLPRPVLKLAVAAGVLDMCANALYLVASQGGPLSVIVTLASLYPASTVLLARIVLGERLNAWQLSGVMCALVAIALIVGGDSLAF
ncbi:MAG: DMT family transporter [Acidobacteria bacterium]|nr:DMT family transporter [Acidobacteriota bacterium]